MELKRIKGLNSLRALAVIGVFFYHALPQVVKGGFFGVLTFFVISGYLKGVHPSKESIFKTYWKRIKRLYPPLIIVLLSSIAVLTMIDLFKLTNTDQEVLSILLGYNNFWQIKMKASYFANLTNSSPFTHLWYFAILIQYELLWPFLYRIYHSIRHAQGPRVALLLFLLVVIVSFLVLPIIVLTSTEINHTNLYYNTFTRIFSLLAGSFLGLLHHESKRIRSLPKIVALLLYAFYLVLTIYLYFTASGTDLWIYTSGMQLYTLLVCLIIHCFVANPKTFRRIVDSRVSNTISRYSYDFYLWQYPVLFLTALYFMENPPIYLLPLQIFLTIVLSVWSYDFVTFLTKRIFKKRIA